MIIRAWAAATLAGMLFLPTFTYADFSSGIQAFSNKDYATALLELQPEAQNGNQIAQNIMGVMYMNGLGVTQNDGEAAKWYQMAANQGYRVAETNLGFLYENGRGVPRNLGQARAWYEKAAAQGDMRAVAFLRRLAMEERFASFAPHFPTPPNTLVSPPLSGGSAPVQAANSQSEELARLVASPAGQSNDNEFLAKIITRSLDNPKRWNESSTEWQPVFDSVRFDLATINRRFEPQRRQIADERIKLLAGIYAASVPPSELNDLLNYFHSEEGKRYQAFLIEVNTVTSNAMTELSGDLLAGGMKDPADISKLPLQEQGDFSKNADARLRVLKLSLYYRAQLSKNDAKAAIVTGNLMGIIAARYGEDLDRIDSKYAPDLDRFEQFSDSQAAQAEVAGFLKAASIALPDQQKLKNEYLAEIASYRAKWLELYINRTKQSPSALPGANT